MMPLTLSPYKYYQIAQYLVKGWAEHVPKTTSAIWKGKGRAEPSRVKVIRRDNGVLRSSLQQSEAGSSKSDTVSSNSIAGPSRQAGSKEPSKSPSPQKPLGPDPNLPKQSTKIFRLMNDERLTHLSTVTPPRDVVVLCHGKLFIPSTCISAYNVRFVRLLDCHSNTLVSFAEITLLGISLRSTEGPNGRQCSGRWCERVSLCWKSL